MGNILCNGTCFFDTFGAKTRKLIAIDDLDSAFKKKKGAKWRIEKNPNYLDPKLRPKWCRKYNKKRIPSFYCLGPISGMKCPFLVISNCDVIEYEYAKKGENMMYKHLRKKYGNEFDWKDIIKKKEIEFHTKIMREIIKEPSRGKIKVVLHG